MVIALSLFSALCVAVALVLTPFGLRTIGPLAGACISVPTTALLFLLAAPLTVGVEGWHAGSAGLFVLAGCLFPATVTLLTFAANRRVGPNLTGALGNLTPLFAVLIAVVLLDEAPGAQQLLGIVVIVAGAALLFVRPDTGGLPVARWALTLPLLAALIRGLVQPVVKLGLADWPNAFAAALIGYLVSALVVLGTGLLRQGTDVLPRRGPATAWFAAVGCANGLAVLSMYTALRYGSVSLVAPLIACYPLATLALSLLLNGRAGVTPPIGFGVAITVTGVALLLLA